MAHPFPARERRFEVSDPPSCPLHAWPHPPSCKADVARQLGLWTGARDCYYTAPSRLLHTGDTWDGRPPGCRDLFPLGTTLSLGVQSYSIRGLPGGRPRLGDGSPEVPCGGPVARPTRDEGRGGEGHVKPPLASRTPRTPLRTLLVPPGPLGSLAESDFFL